MQPNPVVVGNNQNAVVNVVQPQNQRAFHYHERFIIRLPNVNNQYIARYNINPQFEAGICTWINTALVAKTSFTEYCNRDNLYSWTKAILPTVVFAYIRPQLNNLAGDAVDNAANRIQNPAFNDEGLASQNGQPPPLHVFNGLVYDAEGTLQFNADKSVRTHWIDQTQLNSFSRVVRREIDYVAQVLPSWFYKVFEISKSTLDLMCEKKSLGGLPVLSDYYRWRVEKLKELTDANRPNVFRGLLPAQETDQIFLRCQRSGMLMTLPVNCKCTNGLHTFERWKIEEWLLGNSFCPVGLQPLAAFDLLYNLNAYTQNWVRTRELTGNWAP